MHNKLCLVQGYMLTSLASIAIIAGMVVLLCILHKNMCVGILYIVSNMYLLATRVREASERTSILKVARTPVRWGMWGEQVGAHLAAMCSVCRPSRSCQVANRCATNWGRGLIHAARLLAQPPISPPLALPIGAQQTGVGLIHAARLLVQPPISPSDRARWKKLS